MSRHAGYARDRQSTPRDPDPAALDLAAQVLIARRAGRVRDRDRLRPGRHRHPAGRGRADLRRQGEAGDQPAHRARRRHSGRRERAPRIGRADAQRLAEHFWPGPLTLVLRRNAIIPDVVTAGSQTVALRSPRGAVARGLIERVGQPIAAPSANRSNRISPTRAEHVLADLEGRDRPGDR